MTLFNLPLFFSFSLIGSGVLGVADPLLQFLFLMLVPAYHRNSRLNC
jgi:hypothetical protein